MPVVLLGGASSSHHVVPVALTCSWVLLLFHATFGQKPAKLPLISRKPFIAAWNAPLDLCAMKYNITTNLDHLFHIHGSPRANWTGQNVTIFYANRLGYYPYYTLQGAAVHGGLPQNCSLDLHLFKAYQDINHFIPAEDFRGLAVIDWEFWRPQWSRNWYRKDIYRQKSKELNFGDSVGSRLCPQAACQALSEYLTSTFNPYIANVTAAAMLCSELLCQGKGRCVRKNYDSAIYLHLNPTYFRIMRANRKYVAVGLPTAADIDAWAQNFTCQCYAGRSCSPKLVHPTKIRSIWV